MPKRFECKNCGAHLEFDPRSQGLKCDFCGSVEVIEAEHKPAEEHDILSAPTTFGWGLELKAVNCESCGATITSDTGLAGACTFCDSPYVREIPINPDIIRPETVVPFRVDKKSAHHLFKGWLGKGWFRPSNLKNLSRLKLLRGMYMPFWTYDCTAHSDWTAQSGYYYYVTETYYSGGQRRTRQVRKVRWVPSAGSRSGFYDDVLISATQGLDPELLSKIYPFHLDKLVPYKPEFLTGWLAEEYKVSLHQGWFKAKQHVRSKEYSSCAAAVPGDTHRFLNVDTLTEKITYKHILLPIWIAAYNYKNKTYHFLINGQTGEVQGEAPISWAKVGAVAAAIAGIVAAGLFYYYG